MRNSVQCLIGALVLAGSFGVAQAGQGPAPAQSQMFLRPWEVDAAMPQMLLGVRMNANVPRSPVPTTLPPPARQKPVDARNVPRSPVPTTTLPPQPPTQPPRQSAPRGSTASPPSPGNSAPRADSKSRPRTVTPPAPPLGPWKPATPPAPALGRVAKR